MRPVTFPEANTVLGPPPELAGSQCGSIPAHVGVVVGGSVDGVGLAVVAWLPTPEERAGLAEGGPVYLTFLGGVQPHYASTDFHAASHPA